MLPVDAVVLEEVDCLTGSADTKGELEPGVQEGSLVAGAVEDKTTTLLDDTGMVRTDEPEASNCAFLACFLASTLVCHLHKHGLFKEGWKVIPVSTPRLRRSCPDFFVGRFLASASDYRVCVLS